jgi:hypothetical protein
MTNTGQDKAPSKSPHRSSSKTTKSTFKPCIAAPRNNCQKRRQWTLGGYCAKCYKLFGNGNRTAGPTAERNNNERRHGDDDERPSGDDVNVNINGTTTNAAGATNQPEIINPTVTNGINENNNERRHGDDNERPRGDDVNVNINGTTTNAAGATNQPEIINPTVTNGINEIGTFIY